jgi:hypothetical protein
MTLVAMFAPNISFKRIAEVAAARGLTITKACKPYRRCGLVLYDVHHGTDYLGTFSVRGLNLFFSDGNP